MKFWLKFRGFMNCDNWFSLKNPWECSLSITIKPNIWLWKKHHFTSSERSKKPLQKNCDECKVKLTYLKHLNMLLKAMWVKWLLIYSISPYNHTHTVIHHVRNISKGRRSLLMARICRSIEIQDEVASLWCN